MRSLSTQITRPIAIGTITAVTGIALALAWGAAVPTSAAAVSEVAAPAVASPGALKVVATTPILADVTAAIAGERAAVTSAIPRGADPHSFELSIADAVALHDADLVIANGLGLEHGLTSTLAALDGVPLLEVAPLAIGAASTDHDEHDDHDGHDDHDDHDDRGDHGDHDEQHEHDRVDHHHDPHFWTDPTRMIVIADAIGAQLAELLPEHADEIAASTAAYVAELEQLDAEIAEQAAAVPHDRRTLLTSHAMLDYFAARYDFRVAGTIVGVSSQSAASLGDLADLVELIDGEDITVIFVSATQRSDVAESLATEAAGEVAIVAIEVESLGPTGSPTGTYLDMMRTLTTTLVTALSA